MTASAAVTDTTREDGPAGAQAMRRRTSHQVRDAAVVTAIAVTQLVWMALLGYGIWLVT